MAVVFRGRIDFPDTTWLKGIWPRALTTAGPDFTGTEWRYKGLLNQGKRTGQEDPVLIRDVVGFMILATS